MAESEEELKSLLMSMEEESEKAGLNFKLNILRTKIMASGPITSYMMKNMGKKEYGEKVEAVTDFIFLGSKVIACNYEMKRLLLLGRKAVTNLGGKYSKTKTALF